MLGKLIFKLLKGNRTDEEFEVYLQERKYLVAVAFIISLVDKVLWLAIPIGIVAYVSCVTTLGLSGTIAIDKCGKGLPQDVILLGDSYVAEVETDDKTYYFVGMCLYNEQTQEEEVLEIWYESGTFGEGVNVLGRNDSNYMGVYEGKGERLEYNEEISNVSEIRKISPWRLSTILRVNYAE